MAAKKPFGIGTFLFGGFFLALPTSVIATWNWATLSRASLKLWELTYASTPGEVLSSEVESRVDGDGEKRYWVKIAYRYALKGQTFTGTQAESHPLPSDGPWARQYVETHPAGTPVTVRFDSSNPATSVLEPGFMMADALYVLLLFPVNTYLVHLWYYFWRWCFREPTGPAFKTAGSGSQRRVRLRQGTTWAIPLSVAMLGLPASYSLFLVIAGPHASVWLGALVLLSVLALAARLYEKRVSALREGKIDLVVDQKARSLTLPCTFGRRQPVVVAFSSVRSIKVATRRIEGEDSVSYTYRPTVNWKDADGAERGDVLAEWDDQHRAEELASWVKVQVKKR